MRRGRAADLGALAAIAAPRWRGLLAVGLALLVISLAAWAFLELGDEVREGEPIPFDESLLLALRDPMNPADPLGPTWLEEAVRDFTALGSVPVAVLVTLIIVGYLLLARRLRLALLCTVAVLGGMAVVAGVKDLFARDRPDVVPAEVWVETASFPSGHSMIATVMYLTLGALLALLTPSLRVRAYVVAVALALAGLVGFSRVYLGVHYPSDVVAGWALGVVWALPWGLALSWLQRRGEAGRRLSPQSAIEEGAIHGADGRAAVVGADRGEADRGEADRGEADRGEADRGGTDRGEAERDNVRSRPGEPRPPGP